MKTFKTLLFLTATVALGAAAFYGCAHSSKGESAKVVAVQEGVPGGVAIQTHTTTFTVASVDRANRKVVLTDSSGSKTSFKAGPEVRNFNQIEVGDKVKATVTDELVVFLRKSGAPRQDGEAAAIALAPLGTKPGMVMANTIEVTGKVEKLDLKSRKATLRFSDGKSKTFPVRPDVDMTKVNLGDEVTFRNTEALALLVEKP